MGLYTVVSGTVVGARAALVRVEVDARSEGLRQFKVVGLAEHAVSEGRVRVETALVNSGYRPSAHRLTVNLAPAHVRKGGTALDLPIALGILAAQGSPIPGLRQGLQDHLVVGELALDGRVRSVRGCLAYAIEARRRGLVGVVVPRANGREAGEVEGLRVVGVGDLGEAVEVLRGKQALPALPESTEAGRNGQRPPDLADVRGQAVARRALEIAAAGGHNLLLVGPPGAGKTMLARRLPGIWPPMTVEERLEVSVIHSVKGLLPSDGGLVSARPFRAPHHTVTAPSLIGGGNGVPSPGEVSLAHHGVLFLDELPEFQRHTLESLRQPLESRSAVIGRLRETVALPADFVLVATMNPCPCGHAGSSSRDCRCTPARVHAYRSRVSGPLLDRIDLQVRVAAVPWDDLDRREPSEASDVVRKRVATARNRQVERAGVPNARLQPAGVRQLCAPDDEGRRLLRRAVESFDLSARAFDRVLKVARTIADLEASDVVRQAHVGEALHYRFDQSMAA